MQITRFSFTQMAGEIHTILYHSQTWHKAKLQHKCIQWIHAMHCSVTSRKAYTVGV